MRTVTAVLGTFSAACWLAGAVACARSPIRPATTAIAAPVVPAAPPAVPAAAPAPGAAAAEELPEGKGKQILMASCTSCHDLREVTKFRGYYTRAQWHDIVVTMVEYGAAVEKNDVEVLADYLAQHLGRSG